MNDGDLYRQIGAGNYRNNPAPRIGTARKTRVSQVTKQPPTPRLKKRRAKNTQVGYFPNPVEVDPRLSARGIISRAILRAKKETTDSFKQAAVSYAQGIIDFSRKINLITTKEHGVYIASLKNLLVKDMTDKILYCVACRKMTSHCPSHHSGERLYQCATCYTFKPGSRLENPVTPSSRAHIDHRAARDDVDRVAKLYNAFTGHDADDYLVIDKPVMPDVMCVIGDIDELCYTTVRDGVVEHYRHKFKKKSRPLFCVSPDGKSIYMIGGSYEFGERGIIDEE